MPGFDIESFRGNFTGGAKSYLFSYVPMIPTGGNAEMMSYLVNSTSLPANAIEEVPVTWQGFDFKMAGKSSYVAWDVVFRVDKDAEIRASFEQWQRFIHDPTSNVYSSPSQYMMDQHVTLLNDSGGEICTYDIIGAWPSVVSDVPLDYTSTDLAIFTVTFTYQYHTMNKVSYDQ